MFQTRREMLQRGSAGFGMIGLAGSLKTAGLLNDASAAVPDPSADNEFTSNDARFTLLTSHLRQPTSDLHL